MLYTSKLFEIVKTHLPEVHCYALSDITQVFISFSPNLICQTGFQLKKNGKLHIRCLWMLNDNLKLNDDKTEFLIIIWHTRTAGKGGHHEYLRG